MKILGISAFYHDSAAALVIDGKIVAAAQEERFSRKRHDESFPSQAISYCLKQGGLSIQEIDNVVFYDKPFLKFERLLETYLAFAPRGFASFQKSVPIWIKEKLFQKKLIQTALSKYANDVDWGKRLLFTEHHQAHAASAFFPSPFEEALILTMDGVGEWTTTSAAIGSGNRVSIQRELHFPHSIGLLYSAFTYYTGFRVNSGEYKVMGLAPYGNPRYRDLILERLLDLKEDGTFRLDMRYFDFCTGLKMTNDAFDALFGGPARTPDEPLTARHMDLAASIQAAIEVIILRLTRSLASETGLKNLCLAGGVALNCVANGKILRDRRFERVWIQPASGDAGGALGAALAGHYIFHNQSRQATQDDSMAGGYLGPEFAQSDIEKRLTALGAKFETFTDNEFFNKVATAIESGKAVGWFQGRMEFGPRALGARSILGDPRSPTMQRTLNLKVKYRESFRPFAPAVLSEDVSSWFDLNDESPYMLLVADLLEKHRIPMNADQQMLFRIEQLNVVRSPIPAVTHVDYSARIQTVHSSTNARFHRLISAFKEKTGCPILVNTSFNVRGEPIVCTPEDAFHCFMGTDIDILAIGNCLLNKQAQIQPKSNDYANRFDRD
jgi:carbamoyltransferase